MPTVPSWAQRCEEQDREANKRGSEEKPRQLRTLGSGVSYSCSQEIFGPPKTERHTKKGKSQLPRGLARRTVLLSVGISHSLNHTVSDN